MEFDDDRLFEEAAEELEEEIRSNLQDAQKNLPTSDSVWSTSAENIVGVLNQLQSELNTDDAVESFSAAQKSYLLASEAGAFDEELEDELNNQLSTVEEAISVTDSTSETVGELIPEFPELKAVLEEIEDETGPDQDSTTINNAGGREVESDSESGWSEDDTSDPGNPV